MSDSNVLKLYDYIKNKSFDLSDVNRDFRFWQVENLLNQAADLLDRCIIDARTTKSYETQAANLRLDLDKENRLLDLQQQYIKNKGFDSDIELLKVQLKNNKTNRVHYEDAKGNAKVGFDNKGERGTPVFVQAVRFYNDARLELTIQQQQHEIIKFKQGIARKNKEHALAKLKVNQEIYEEKKELTVHGEILDFHYQSEIASNRCQRDFKDAYNRLLSANIGLKELFGYTGPDLPLYPNKLGERDEPIHKAVTWVRDAIQWMIRFSHHDQSFTMSVSLSEILDNDAFQDVVNNSRLFYFRIPEEYFSNHKFIRVRGLSCFVNCDENVSKPWKVILNAPKSAVVYFGDKYNTIPQDSLSSFHFGRVENRNSYRAPEIVGSVSHINTSPYGVDGDEGRWLLEVVGSEISKSEYSKINDIQLDLYLVGQ